ncbi:MAG: hypothetical protein VX511_02535 [Candidatus Thermoplasmatota archaeon]|nr:hypothetical protein [Candidatus Thermoplasmatota archaeon]
MESLDAIRLVIGAVALGYGAWSDWQTRRVPDRTWQLAGGAGLALLAVELWQTQASAGTWGLAIALGALFWYSQIDDEAIHGRELTAWRAIQVAGVVGIAHFALFEGWGALLTGGYAVELLAALALMVMMYGWYYFGPTIGGADVKALLTVAVLVPFAPDTGATLQAFGDQGFPFPWVVFMNSLLLYLAIPIGLLVWNIAHGNLEKPWLQALLGVRMDLTKARESFVWPMTRVVGNRTVLAPMVKRDLDLPSEWDALATAGVMHPWVSLKVPYIIPLFGAFLLSAFVGDLFSELLVAPLGELFQ